jgi:hypothetical protein
MDSTHQTNHLEWYLYNLCVRDEQGSWCPVAHILTAREDSDITAEGLRVLKKWCGGCWHLRYMLTDDSAGEQCAVRKAFPGLEVGELEPTHFLCKVHSERTLQRNFKGKEYADTLKHLLTALKYRKSRAGCEESIQQAIRATRDEKKRKYIQKEWLTTMDSWANFARTHSCLLLQVS